MNTIDFLDAVKKRYRLPSDNALSKALGVTRSAIHKFQTGHHVLGMDAAIKVAILLDLPAPFVLASVKCEREMPPEEKKMWQEIADRFDPDKMSRDERIAHAQSRLSA